MQRCIWAKSPEAPTRLHSTGTVQITPRVSRLGVKSKSIYTPAMASQ